MPKFILVTLISLLAFQSVRAYEEEDLKKRKIYHIAVNGTNPFSAFCKYGGGLEQRFGNVAIIQSYTKYTGAYPGKRYGFEVDKYIKTKKRHEYFIYWKYVFGEASFESKKLSIYGEKTDINLGPELYVGGATGVGRRYNFDVLFVRWNLGLKYCPLVTKYDYQPYQDMYRLFYATGPGSIIELNFTFGIQL